MCNRVLNMHRSLQPQCGFHAERDHRRAHNVNCDAERHGMGEHKCPSVRIKWTRRGCGVTIMDRQDNPRNPVAHNHTNDWDAGQDM